MSNDPQAYATDPTNSYRVSTPAPCEACGGPAHGSVNVELACFKMHLRGARLQMLTPEDLAEWQAWKAIQADVRGLPLSPHEKISKIKRIPK
jgi:hypothetical protein